MNRAEPTRQSAGGTENIGGLLSGLLRDLQGMVRGEIALARTEIKEDVSTIRNGVTSLAIALVFALTGFIFLMLGATYVLNMYMRMWLAAVIVGLASLLIAGLFAMAGKRKLSTASLAPTQTIESLKETKTWAQQQMNSDSR